MKKYLTALCAMVLLMANAQAATHPTCKKFFSQMDAEVSKMTGEQRQKVQDQWTPTKAAIVKQDMEKQAKTCQNGMNSLRKIK